MEFHLLSNYFLNLNIMRFLNLLVCALVGFSAQAQNLADTQWQLYPGAGALGVGPNQGDIGWWSNNDGDVATRACLFDDIYAFNADGSFQNILGDETWVEGWQTGAGEMAVEAPLLLTTVQPLLLGLWMVINSRLMVRGPSWVLPKSPTR